MISLEKNNDESILFDLLAYSVSQNYMSICYSKSRITDTFIVSGQIIILIYIKVHFTILTFVTKRHSALNIYVNDYIN